jgi:hypothetical protein
MEYTLLILSFIVICLCQLYAYDFAVGDIGYNLIYGTNEVKVTTSNSNFYDYYSRYLTISLFSI